MSGSVEIPDEAVLAATRALATTFATNRPVNGTKDFTIDARAALVAARPYLMPSRDAVREAVAYWMPGERARHIDDATDAVMAAFFTGKVESK